MMKHRIEGLKGPAKVQTCFSPMRAVIDVSRRGGFFSLCLLLFLFSLPACTSTRYTTHTQKSGIEQLLVARALEKALEEPPAHLKGGNAFLEVSSLMPELDYFIGKGLEHWLLKGGVTLIGDRRSADCIVSVLVKAIGTDGNEYNLGIPPLPIPLINWATPPVTLFSGSVQKGYVEIEVMIYPFGERLKEEMVPLIGKSHYKRYTLLFIPMTFQNIYRK